MLSSSVVEPERQVEIQLGHMCNNRCRFCVSGQRTGMGAAGPLDVEPILARIRGARAQGHGKITLLGGEPTLQPGFLDVVRECVALGFDEIVLFTNGVKTARGSFVDEVLATGGRFIWRLSIQGATRESHENTTRRPGSFARILKTLEALHRRGERITVNMCVVVTNYESVDRFPDLLQRYGVRQLHLDLMRPLDAGHRTDEELRSLMPAHASLVAPLTRMIEGFREGFDVNIGNVPYCVAPKLIPWIHHDGEQTDTIAVDGDAELSEAWDKYQVKRRDKVKPASCRDCLLEDRCSGVFETYARFHGTSELVPVTLDVLRAADPERKLVALHLRERLRRLPAWSAEEMGIEETHLRWDADAAVVVALRREDLPGAVARFDGVSVHLLSASATRGVTLDALRGLADGLIGAGHAVVHPPGPDAVGECAPSVAQRLRRLREAAPFGPLCWRDLRVIKGGNRVELDLVGNGGDRATVWLDEIDRRARGGYLLADGPPQRDIVEGLGALMLALRH